MEYRIMSDNEVSKNKLSDNSDTEKKEAATLSSGTSTTKTSATEMIMLRLKRLLFQNLSLKKQRPIPRRSNLPHQALKLRQINLLIKQQLLH